MGNDIIIVCAGNREFFTPMKVMLKSLLVNTKQNVNGYIMNCGWTVSDKEIFKKSFLDDNIKLNFIDVPKYECFNEFKISDDITIESYFRLFIPELLPDNIEKVVYLDADLVVEGDIKELWEIDMKDSIIMAVTEMNSKAYLVSSPLALPSYQDLCIPEKCKYFNAGVLKIDLKKWKQLNLSKKIITYLINNKEKVLWHDQDGLNAILWDKWTELPKAWNVMTALFFEKEYEKIGMNIVSAEQIMNNPKIIHYTNRKDKPWKNTCMHPLKNRYFYYKNLLA